MVQKSVFMERVFTLRNLRSASAAAVIEVLIAAGITALLIWQQVGPTIVPPPPIADPIANFLPQTPPLPRNVPTLQAPDPSPLHEVQPIQTSIPSPTAEPVLPPTQPLVPEQRSLPPADLVSGFTSGMLQAINQQKVYPKISMLRGDTGEAVVSFDYVDGVVNNVRVDRSSGFRDLDQAAIQAVQKAALPPKPAELVGLRHFVFHLAFGLSG